MIFDFDYLKSSQLPDIVIIGSGPAGMTLSMSLEKRGISSLIVEAGSEDLSDKLQETCAGEVIGDEYFDLEYSHLKILGGSSNHWSGVCRPLDSIDFQKKGGIAGHFGWPLEKSDLDPYEQEASSILEVGQFRESTLSDHLKEVEFSFSPPVRFSDKYRNFFSNSSKAHLCLNSNVVSLSASGGRINKIYLAHLNGAKTDIEPKIVVLCMGGIENSRILLWSNEVSPEPVVPLSDTLGKYWFEHPHNMAGEVTLFQPLNKFENDWDVAFFAPTRKAIAEFEMLNASLRVWQASTAHKRRSGPFIKSLTRELICRSRIVGNLSENFRDTRIGCMNASVELVWEQEPIARNRVDLSASQRDVFGVPRPVLYWQKSPKDYRTAKIMMELFGRYLAETNTGMLKVYDHIIDADYHPPSSWMAGHHHMGGTRMADRADLGVVDQNLKIFGINNAYVLGSSVFPSGGHANPTYTIVQLALRLADQLAAESL